MNMSEYLSKCGKAALRRRFFALDGHIESWHEAESACIKSGIAYYIKESLRAEMDAE